MSEIMQMNVDANVEKDFRKQKVLRFKFDPDFIVALTNFAKIHQYDNRQDYKEAWENWINENNDIVSREKIRLEQLGYKGDVHDKMYKSSRYYFRTKNLAPVVPVKRRKYLSIGSDMLNAIDAHIKDYLTTDKENEKQTPAGGFADFQENNVKLIEDTIAHLVGKKEKGEEAEEAEEAMEIQKQKKDVTFITKEEANQKVKKTYKNRYFVAVRSKGM